jgi:hypothetical protein
VAGKRGARRPLTGGPARALPRGMSALPQPNLEGSARLPEPEPKLRVGQVLLAWQAKEMLVLKRSLSAGYARLHNPVRSAAACPPLPRPLRRHLSGGAHAPSAQPVGGPSLPSLGAHARRRNRTGVRGPPSAARSPRAACRASRAHARAAPAVVGVGRGRGERRMGPPLLSIFFLSLSLSLSLSPPRMRRAGAPEKARIPARWGKLQAG